MTNCPMDTPPIDAQNQPDGLAKPEMTAIVSTVATDGTGAPLELRWRPCGDQFARNDSWGAFYECAIHVPNGRPAICGQPRFLMPR